MSIRNITTENNSNDIFCNELKSNNINSDIKDIELIEPDNQFYTINTTDPKAVCLRIGEYVICNGVFNITFDNGITDKSQFEIEIKIIGFDETLSDYRIMGGNGRYIDPNEPPDPPKFCFPTFVNLETGRSCILRFDSELHFDATTNWNINYSISFKLTDNV